MGSILERAPKLQKIWDLQALDNKLYNFVLQSYPEIVDALEMLQGHCPVAPTCKVFSEGDFFRLKGHARSFCLKTGNGVLVFKGSEPYSNDYLSFYEQTFTHPINHMLSKIDGFALLGHEIYLAITRKNALNTADITKQFVKDYQVKIKKLPHVPIPLSVFKIPEEATTKFLNTTSKFLSNRFQFSVFDYNKLLAQDGLAIYIYYYSGYPLRAAHLIGQYPFAIGGNDSIWESGNDLEKEKKFDLEKISGKWVKLIATMLGIGYIPTTWLHTGNCMQIQNLVMNGGVYAIDSIVSISKLKFDRNVIRAILISIQTFAKSLAILTSVKLEIAFAAVWNEISNEIKLNHYKLNYDPRIVKLFNSRGLDLIIEISNNMSLTV